MYARKRRVREKSVLECTLSGGLDEEEGGEFTGGTPVPLDCVGLGWERGRGGRGGLEVPDEDGEVVEVVSVDAFAWG